MAQASQGVEPHTPVLQYVELNLRDYWRIFRKRRWVALAAGLIIFSGIYGSARRQTPLYESRATIRIVEHKKIGLEYLGEQILGSSETEISSYARVIKSLSILERVAHELSLAGPGATDDQIQAAAQALQGRVATRIVEAGHSLTNLIEIKVTDANPRRAAQIANKTSDIFIEEDLNGKRRQARQVRIFIEQQIEDVKARLRQAEDAVRRFQERETPVGLALPMQHKLMDLRAEKARLLRIYTPLHPELQRLEEQSAQLQQQLTRLSSTEIAFARLAREVEINNALYRNLEQRLAGARIAEAEHVQDIVVVDAALPETTPVSPNLTFSLILGLVLGSFASGFSALAIEQFDTSIGTIEDVEAVLKAPVVGLIPHIRASEHPNEEEVAHPRWPWQRRHRPLDETRLRLYSHFCPKTPGSEAFRTVRTMLRKDRERKLILITSTMPREGKTTVLINLGIVCAQSGDRVLLVALDLRKPQIDRTFGLRRSMGVSEVLSGASTYASAVKRLADIAVAGRFSLEELLKTPGLDNLAILPAGQIPANPAELLSTPQLGTLLEQAKAEFDLVLVDAPPVLAITDALLIAPRVDGVVLVYQSGRTARQALSRAKTQVEGAGGTLIGAILNDVRPESEMDVGYYYYRYRYSEPSRREEQSLREESG